MVMRISRSGFFLVKIWETERKLMIVRRKNIFFLISFNVNPNASLFILLLCLCFSLHLAKCPAYEMTHRISIKI